MASPRMSRGVGPPNPLDIAALQPETMLCGEREGAVGTAPCPAACVAVPASRLWCRAFLVLTMYVSATAVPYSLGTLAAVTWGPPGSPACQQEMGDNLVTAYGDPLTLGCFPGVQGGVTHGIDADGWSVGTATVTTPTSQTSLQWQPGSRDRKGLRLCTAVAVTLPPPQWLGKRVPATSTQPFQTEGDPSPGSWHHLALGNLYGAEPGSHDATQVPAVTSAGGLGQPAGTAELQTPQRGSEGTHRAQGEPAARVPATFQVWLDPPSLPTAASAGATVMEVAPTQLVPPQGVAGESQGTPDVPAWMLVDAASWSHSPTGQVPSALPAEGPQSSAELHAGSVWVPPTLTPEGLWGTAGTVLPGKAALLVDAALAQVQGNESGRLDTVLTSLPSAALAPSVHNQQVLASFLPTAKLEGPAVTSGKQSDLPSVPAQLMSTEASPAQTRTPSPESPTVTGMSFMASGVIRELGQMFVMEESRYSKPRTALLGPTPTPAGPPEPTSASPGSVPPPSSTNPAPEHGSEAGRHTVTTDVVSPSCLPTSPGAGHAASSLLSSQTLAVPTGVTLDAQSMPSSSITSQHSSTAMEHLPAATREAFSPAELMMGKSGSTGMKLFVSPTSRLPSLTQPVHVLPLQFRLLGITYTPALGSRNSESYRQLEEDVRLMLNQLLSSYETFLQANVLEFMNGSVVVRGEILFRGDAPAPTNSHLIRTVITEVSKGKSIFSWQLEPQSVQSSDFSLENLDPEKLSISLTGSQFGMSRMDPLERLISEVTSSVTPLYHVRNFTISQLRNLNGNLEITGDLYLDTVVHADVTEVLQALTALSALSVDLTSLSVEGSRLRLHAYPLSFVITNRYFSQKLQDPLSVEHQNLSRDLGDAVARALRDHPTFLKVMIKEFLPGSLICHGAMIFHHPAPTSTEVLEALVLSVGPNQALANSDIHVDPYSLAVGEDTLEPPSPQPGFPAYGVAFMVVGGLCIIIAPIVLVCLGTKRLGWQDGRALWDRRDPELGIQTLEMDNQGFWTEGPEDGNMHWQSTSV